MRLFVLLAALIFALTVGEAVGHGPPSNGSGGSGGDMLKSTYDTDDDDVVERAAVVDFDGSGDATLSMTWSVIPTWGVVLDTDDDAIMDFYFKTDRTFWAPGGIIAGKAVTEVTSTPYNITAAYMQGEVYSTVGTATNVQMNLPACTAAMVGSWAILVNAEPTYTLTVHPDTGEIIHHGDIATMAVNDKIATTGIGSSVTIMCSAADEWVTLGSVGTWTDAGP